MEAIIQAANGVVLKQNTQHGLVVGFTVMAMVIVTGCAQPPTEQLGAAQEAVDLASAAGATAYAKEDFAALEQQFAIAKDELAMQERTRSIGKTRGENPLSRRYSRLGHHDARRILSNHSTCEAGPISPMRQTVIRAVDRAPLAGHVYARCYDELV